MNTNDLLSNLPYPEQVAYHKGAFAALMSLENVVHNMQRGANSKLFTKKGYKLITSYIREASKHVDEFLGFRGIPYGIVSKDGEYIRISEDEAHQFIQKN